MKRSTQKRFEAIAGQILDRIVPGAGEMWGLVVEAIDERDRARVAPLPTDGAEPLEPVESHPIAGDDTIAVEITDARGRVVGWTIARVKR